MTLKAQGAFGVPAVANLVLIMYGEGGDGGRWWSS